MTADRLDILLERALAEGVIPPEASPDERLEIEALVAASGALATGRQAIESELRAALPVARARFERLLAPDASPAGAAALPARRGGRALPGWLTLPRLAPFAGALAVLVFLAVVVVRTSLGDVETAVALESGDYVQFEGTVADVRATGSDLELVLRTGAGRYVVRVAATAVIRAASGSEVTADSLSKDTVVVVDGLVEDGRVRASTVVLGDYRPAAPSKLTRLREVRGRLLGTVLLLRLHEDGARGEVVVLTDDGRRVVVPVTGATVEGLLQWSATSPGQRVELGAAANGLFSVDPVGSGPQDERPTAPRPALVTVRGVIASLTGGRLEVRTPAGPASVTMTPRTRVLAARSGLTPTEVRDGAAVAGHTVAVVGHRDPQTGSFVADLVTVGPRLAPAR